MSRTCRFQGGVTLPAWERCTGIGARGATLSTVSDQLGVTLSATSRLIDGLVAKQLVKRTVSLELTPAGTKALLAAMKETHKELARPLAKLSVKERKLLCKAVATLQRAMGGDGTGQG